SATAARTAASAYRAGSDDGTPGALAGGRTSAPRPSTSRARSTGMRTRASALADLHIHDERGPHRMAVARPEPMQQIEVEALLDAQARLAAGDLVDPRARQQIEQHAEQLVLLTGVLRPRRDDQSDAQAAVAVGREAIDRQRRGGPPAGERLLG